MHSLTTHAHTHTHTYMCTHAFTLTLCTQEWNDELASIAQTYAAQCRFEHNDQRNSQSPSYTFVGENIFVTSSQSADYTGAVRDWYNEVADYDYSTNGCSRVCGHYTQVSHGREEACRNCVCGGDGSATNAYEL